MLTKTIFPYIIHKRAQKSKFPPTLSFSMSSVQSPIYCRIYPVLFPIRTVDSVFIEKQFFFNQV